jgi:hypothetical protein
MSSTVEACADLVGSSIAQRVFQQRFPRLSYRLVIRENWKDGEDAVLLALVSSTAIVTWIGGSMNHRTHLTHWAAISILSGLSLLWHPWYL